MMVKMTAVLGSAALAVSSAALALPAGVAASAPAPMEAGLLRTAPAPLFGSGTVGSTFLSSNWAGFVDGDSTTAGNQLTPGDATFDGVSGTWKVPTLVVPPGHGQVGAWVGIGGVNGNLLQVGTGDVWVGGRPEAFAFWEAVPGEPAQVGPPVPMGATVTGSVSYDSAHSAWTLTLTEGTRTIVSEQVPSASFTPDQSNAEWITEDPTCLPSGRLCPFASFLPVHFSNLSVTFAPDSASRANVPFSRLLIASPSGRPRVEVSPDWRASLPRSFTVTRLSAWGLRPVVSPSPWGPGGPVPHLWGQPRL